MVPTTKLGAVTEYDVCLSFAGEDRPYVDEVNKHLKEMGIRSFYDYDEQDKLWGEELTEYLDKVYREQSRFCVMFVSKDYVRKVWTIHERRSALARGLENPGQAYVLPARFDDTPVPGIRPSVGYIDLRNFTPRRLAEMIARRLGVQPGPPPAGWEYRTFADVVRQGLRKLDDKRRAHDMTPSHVVRAFTTDAEAINHFTACTQRFDEIIESIARVLSPENQEWAFGAPGQAGDTANIQDLGNRFTAIYESLLDWSADLRATSTPPRLRPLYLATARLADQPLRQIEEFVTRFATQESGELRLTIDYDPSSVEAELAKVQTT